MKKQDFQYDLPPGLIAQVPLKTRSESRLLRLDGGTGNIAHDGFSSLPDLLAPGDLLVFNDTRVVPARLLGRKESGGKVEILIERILEPLKALAHVRNAPRIGASVILENGSCIIIDTRRNDLFVLTSQNPWTNILEKIGYIPLPPYIARADENSDRERYQTVYAKHAGSAAAPTAGLHFDETMLQKIKDKGVDHVFVTLHVGAGTFQPVRVDNIKDHKMHAEYISVGQKVCDKIRRTREKGGRVIAVGTTSLRCLETAALKPFEGETDIFIYPGYEFKSVDALITNFHLPESTLLMLVCAFAGYENAMNAYRAAVSENYRFFSYGDAMFITRNSSQET